jgi:P-type conjugative transfer protein TrbL
VKVGFTIAATVALAFSAAALAQTGQQNIAALIAHYESSGDPTAQNPNLNSTASGLYGFTNATWQTYAQQMGVNTQQYPSAYLAPASVQTAVFYQDFNTHGLSDWTCAGCDPKATAAIQAAGGPSAFAQGSTDPASYAALDTSSGLQAYLASNGTPNISVSQVDPSALTGAGGPTTDATGNPTDFSGGAATVGTGAPAPTGIGTSGGIGSSGGLLDNIISSFKSATSGWGGGLLLIATDIFTGLALIELILCYMLPAIYGGGVPNLEEGIFIFCRWFMPVALFNAIMLYGNAVSQAIVDTLRQAAGALGYSAITPSAIIGLALNATGTIWQDLYALFDSKGGILIVWFSDALIDICLILSAVWMAIALIESYFIVGATALYMAFGALRFSRPIATTLLFYCVAIGFKLFGIAAIDGVASNYISQWASLPGSSWTFTTMWQPIGIAVFMAAASKFVPDTMHRIAAGAAASYAQAHHVTTAAAGAFSAAVSPIIAALGGMAATIEAMRLAGAQIADKGESEGSSGGIGATLAAAAGNFAGAAAEDIGAKLGGRGGSFSGSGFRMARNLANQRRLAEANRQRPK